MLQLSDVFEEFRTKSFETYGLDPAFYLSSPQLSWDAMLKKTEIKLELVSDPEMFKMIDSGIRGGVSMISTRYAHANNPQMGALYDKDKPTSFIKGLDANNLYGWAMSQYLPTGQFEWVKQEDLANINWTAQTEEQQYGYVVKVDLDYPVELHEAHNDFPLAPERIYVQEKWISDNQRTNKANYQMPRRDMSSKLIPNLMHKRDYVVDYRNLKFYLEHGLKLVKVHCAIKYKQSKWMAPYISLNQTKRQQTRKNHERDLYKLMNNSVFGKTCENQKKRTNIKLVTDEKTLTRLLNKPELMNVDPFGENFAAIQLQKIKLKINKRFYVGFVILELAKLFMYR